MQRALIWSTIAVTLLSAGVATADDNLKGTYSFVGLQMCLTAPGGFKEDSKGNSTIPIGETNFGLVTSQGQVVYNGDGTGKGTQTFVAVVPVNPNGAAVSGGTASFEFTYARESDQVYRMTLKPGSYKGTLDAGPNAGQQFSVDTGSRLLRVSSDRKHVSLAIAKPYLEKITFSGSSEPVPRVCTWIGNQSRAD